MSDRELFKKYPPVTAINILQEMSEEYNIPLEPLKDLYHHFRQYLSQRMKEEDTLCVYLSHIGKAYFLTRSNYRRSTNPADNIHNKIRKEMIDDIGQGYAKADISHYDPPIYVKYALWVDNPNTGGKHTIETHARFQNELFKKNNVPSVEKVGRFNPNIQCKAGIRRHEYLLGKRKKTDVPLLSQKLNKYET